MLQREWASNVDHRGADQRVRITQTSTSAPRGSAARHPPDPCTNTVRYSPTSHWSAVVAVNASTPETPVLDCQATVQLVVAVTGHFQLPPVRSFSERQANLCPHGGSARQSYSAGGGAPGPWQVTVVGVPEM